MIESNYLNQFGSLLFSVLILSIMLSIILILQFTFAEPSLKGSIYPIVKGTYTIPSEGFQITLPDGWTGIDLNPVAIVSPTGIDLKTGSVKRGGDSILMVLDRANVSDYLEGMNHYNTSKYADYIKKIAETVGCKVLSDKFIKIKGMKSEELTEQCGSHGEEKTISYVFTSRKNMIFVGLKASGLTFDNNLEKFKQSIQSIKINDATDIEDIILGYTAPTR
jgi:hypothetical protein